MGRINALLLTAFTQQTKGSVCCFSATACVSEIALADSGMKSIIHGTENDNGSFLLLRLFLELLYSDIVCRCASYFVCMFSLSVLCHGADVTLDP